MYMYTLKFSMNILRRNKKSPEIKRLKLLQNAVEIVAVNGRPFNCIRDSSYQANIKNELKKLRASGFPLNLSDTNSPEVKTHLHTMAHKVISKIAEEVKGRPLSLMVDITTKNGRSIFGASIQFIINGKLKIRSIGMVELHRSHTALYLTQIVCERLQLFGIDFAKF